MGKKYKGRKCVYCAESISVTADHVFAREFFLESQRNNLPKVPACAECNKDKSVLEYYLTAILPFGGIHREANKNLATMVPKRLNENKKLHNELRVGMTYMQNKESMYMGLPLKGETVTELFKYIAKGLSWFHWDIVIDKDTPVHARALNKAGESFFDRLFLLNAKRRIENAIGIDSFSYAGAQGDADQLTVWKFKIYGGIKMADSKNKDSLKNCSNSIGVITGSSEF